MHTLAWRMMAMPSSTSSKYVLCHITCRSAVHVANASPNLECGLNDIWVVLKELASPGHFTIVWLIYHNMATCSRGKLVSDLLSFSRHLCFICMCSDDIHGLVHTS